MTTMNDAEREAFEDWLGIKPCGAAHDLAAKAFQAGAAWQRAQGAVPDVSAMAKALSDRVADACCVDPDDNWKIYGQEYIEDVQAMLAAAPAHQAERQGEVQGRWIPVSERLPSVAQEVIVNSEFDGVTAGFLDSYGEWYSPNSDYKLTRVVAWQPLPAAPAPKERKMSEVERYWPEEIVGTGELVVYAQDYAALEAERDALAAELAAIKEQGEAVEVVGWLGGNGLHAEENMASGAPFPLMTVAQHNRILAARVPAGCKVVPVDLIERTICRLTHGHEHDKAVRELRALLVSAEGVKNE